MNDLPTIRLAERDWPVKPLVLKQLRVVEPAWARLKGTKTITEQFMDDLTEICYQAIAPLADPKITRSDFTDLPVTTQEMITALEIIAKQAGMARKDGAKGEAPAASPSTGTASPPNSATT